MRLSRPFVLAMAAVFSAATLAAQGQGQIRRAMMMYPSAQHSPAAERNFAQGMHAMDFGDQAQARDRFQAAVAADPAWAFAYLQLANNANSLDEYRANLERAERNAAGATPAERLLIQMARKDFENDLDGELALARQLVEAQPGSPRALMELAAVQQQRGDQAGARATLQRATATTPPFAPAFLALGTAYLNEPRDLRRAEAAIARAVALAPGESYVYDLQGDVLRQEGKLQQARAAYTRSAALAPREGSPLQQRGHVNSLLGDYARARADYERAAALGRGNEPATYPVWRALVNVHAGDPRAAVDELDRLVTAIDGMNVPDRDGSKVFALEEEARIALHTGMLDRAESAIARRNALARAMAERGGTDEYRRGEEAGALYWEGMLAARRGDYAGAAGKARQMMAAVEPLRAERKNEPAHELLGMIELLQGHFAPAVPHFEAADPNDTYAAYHHALALAGAGRAAEARALFQRVAADRFNNAGVALVRKDAAARAGAPR